MLVFARVAGETSPLLFTAFGNQFWSFNLTEPIAALPLQIYVYAISPYDEWHRLAWAGSLVLIVMIMVAVTLVRIYASRGVLKGAIGLVSCIRFRQRTNVLLPHPDGPISAVAWFAGSSTLMSCSVWVVPYHAFRCSTLMLTPT